MATLLFWSAVIAAVVGMHSPDGNLFYFIAAHLTMLTICVSLRRRGRTRKSAPAKAGKPS
jgi:hypothetical protein